MLLWLCQCTKTFPAKTARGLTANKIPPHAHGKSSQGPITQLQIARATIQYCHCQPLPHDADNSHHHHKDVAWPMSGSCNGLPWKDPVWNQKRPAIHLTHDVWTKLHARHKKWQMSTAFHPQTDGWTECVNQEIKQFSDSSSNINNPEWINWLPMAEFSYMYCNNRMQATWIHAIYCSTNSNTSDYLVKRLVVKSLIFYKIMITYLKGKWLVMFPRFRKNQGGGQILEVKNKKKSLKIEQLAHVNLIVIMLKSLLYTKTGIQWFLGL